MSKIFINYRRSDCIHAAHALCHQLRSRFGLNNVFMDVNSIAAGTVWPARIEGAVGDADVVLVLVGPNWLKAADEYHRRRLDASSDWVRKEIETAISAKKVILPVVIGGAKLPRHVDALPAELISLFELHEFELRDESWVRDVDALVKELVDRHRLRESGRQEPPRLPKPLVEIGVLTPEEIDQALSRLPDWEPVESTIPGDYPNTRQELRRAFTFPRFRDAIGFMSSVVPITNAQNHHPRWENQWKTVTVWLTTWDIGNRISQLDVNLARDLDDAYLDFLKTLE